MDGLPERSCPSIDWIERRNWPCATSGFSWLGYRGASWHNPVPSAEWTYIFAQTSGWSQSGLADAKAFSDAHNVTALMVVSMARSSRSGGDLTGPTELASIRGSLA